MRLVSAVFDDFFDDPIAVRSRILSMPHSGVTSPYDNVLYPNIAHNLDSQTQEEFIRKVSEIMHNPIDVKLLFSRISNKGIFAKHQVHTDAIVGNYTALVYLNPNSPEDLFSGTSVLDHVNGMHEHPKNDEELKVWQEDANDPMKWKVSGFCGMKFNRLFLLDARLYHRSEPIGGFGEGDSSRHVLSMFFNIGTTK